MTVGRDAGITIPEDSTLKNAIYLEAVAGGKETNPLWTSQVGNLAFESALRESLKAHRLLAQEDKGGTGYALTAELIEMDQPFIGFDMTVKSTVFYRLKKAGADFFEKRIVADYTARMSDTWLGFERLRLANQGSIRENIKKFIRELLLKTRPTKAAAGIPLDSSSGSAVGERWKRAEIKEYVILSYKQILADLGKEEGNYLESLLQMLKIESEQRDEAIDKIRKLSEVYTVIPEFADRTIDLYAKAAVEAKPTPAAAPVAVTAQPPTEQPQQGMVRIEGGEFRMGGDGEPVQFVRLSGFLIDESEVTQAAFQQAMGFNPSKHRGADNPVDNVSWHNAKEYCEKAGKRLPTEAEWEYTARAGTTSKYFFGDYGSLLPNFANLCGDSCQQDDQAYVESDGNLEVAPVKSFKPNPWGLYDVYGNVAEWVSDWYGYYGGGSVENPTGPPHGALKVLRGGSWSDSQGLFAPALRDKAPPAVGKPTIGFRCAVDAQ